MTIKPKTNGGSNNYRNLIDLCVPCHDQLEGKDWSDIWRAKKKLLLRTPINKQYTLATGQVVAWSHSQQIWQIWTKENGYLIAEPYNEKKQS